jgi:hypothetical protein
MLGAWLHKELALLSKALAMARWRSRTRVSTSEEWSAEGNLNVPSKLKCSNDTCSYDYLHAGQIYDGVE